MPTSAPVKEPRSPRPAPVTTLKTPGGPPTSSRAPRWQGQRAAELVGLVHEGDAGGQRGAEVPRGGRGVRRSFLDSNDDGVGELEAFDRASITMWILTWTRTAGPALQLRWHGLHCTAMGNKTSLGVRRPG
jgi:hypothetical protein